MTNLLIDSIIYNINERNTGYMKGHRIRTPPVPKT